MMTNTACNTLETDVPAFHYVRIPFWRLMDYALTGAEYLVYSCLLAHSDDHHQAFPSYDTVARQVHLSPSTVQRAIRSLENKGLLRKQTRLVVKDFPDGSLQQRYTSNLYTLLITGATPSAPGRLNPSSNTRSSVKMTPPSITMTQELDPVNSLQPTTTSTSGEREEPRNVSAPKSSFSPMPREVLETKIVVSGTPTTRLKATSSLPQVVSAPIGSTTVSWTPLRHPVETMSSPDTSVSDPLLIRLERVLAECLRRPYHFKPNDVIALERLRHHDIPDDWIVQNTSNVVAERHNTPIHCFGYIALVLEDWWKGRVQRSDTTPRIKPRHSPSHARSSKVSKPEKDPRYEAFYALFPEDSQPTPAVSESTHSGDDRYANFYKLFPEEKTRLS